MTKSKNNNTKIYRKKKSMKKKDNNNVKSKKSHKSDNSYKKNKTRKNKQYPKICRNGLSFNECELTILRQAVDDIEINLKKDKVKNPTIKRIIHILEEFLKSKQLICYGGTAINNILPEEDQFYNKNINLPDYDFFSPNAIEDAKKLADIYYKKGFTEVEAKAGIHYGTYKVFVNFIPIADITQMDKALYNSLKNESIKIGGINYAPPNYLRMSMYLELSRPEGDISRWEKVLKRLNILNKNYPLKGIECDKVKLQRIFESKKFNEKDITDLFYITRNSCIDQGLVFFGSFAHKSYMNKLPNQKYRIKKIPDFDVISDDPELSATIIKERLSDSGFKKIGIKKRDKIGEIIPLHYEVTVDDDTIIFIYEPIACHSYNEIKINKKTVRIASIDTILSFYLAFLYANKPYYDKNRILCMAEYLFTIQEKNRLKQKGILKRFNLECYGIQPSIRDIRSTKTEMYKKLKHNKDSKKYNEWFLRYRPEELNENKNNRKTQNRKKYIKENKTKKNKNSTMLSKIKKLF